MFDESTFNAIAGGLLLIGGFVWFFWDAARPPKADADDDNIIMVDPKPKKRRKKKARPKKPTKPQVSPETLAAMHRQADAERAIAEALERKTLHTPDPVKHARLEKQAANSWLRFHKILDRIDKITMQ